MNALKDEDFSARCPECGHDNVFFGVEAVEIHHGQLTRFERMELEDEELEELGLTEDDFEK